MVSSRAIATRLLVHIRSDICDADVVRWRMRVLPLPEVNRPGDRAALWLQSSIGI